MLSAAKSALLSTTLSFGCSPAGGGGGGPAEAGGGGGGGPPPLGFGATGGFPPDFAAEA